MPVAMAKTLGSKNFVGAGADGDLPLLRVGLAVLVEGHHDHGRPVSPEEPRLPDELLLALLEAYGVDDRLALHALEALLDDGPLGRVDHDGHARDVRLAGDQVEEAGHSLLAVEHPLVHIDVYDLGAVLDLLSRHLQRRLVLVRQDEVLEPPRARDVSALPDVDEQRVGPDVARLEAGEARETGYLRYLARRAARDRLGYRRCSANLL
jgi:hypothetical protein